MKKQLMIAGVLVVSFLICNTAKAQTIGPANGTIYEIISVSYEWRACSCCGFNDLSIPNQAKYKIEHRKYHRYNNEGKEVEVWYKEVEVGWTGDCRETG